MGRLVLNVLLSFAQFERELIAERTRDKMAAARRKGKWGGGLPVLGYDVDRSSKKLVVNEVEAARVRAIFALYLQHHGLLPVLAELARRGWCTKQTRTKDGHVHGGRPFTRSSLYRLLTNVTYVGQVRYRNEIHPGEQPAIIDPTTWQDVLALLGQNGLRRTGTVRTPSEALLQGLLFCRPCGCAMTPAQVTRGNRRNRYFTCSAAQRKGWHTCPSKSLPAAAVERGACQNAPQPGGQNRLVRVLHFWPGGVRPEGDQKQTATPRTARRGADRPPMVTDSGTCTKRIHLGLLQSKGSQ
jgi:site-specific DNA recombinase